MQNPLHIRKNYFWKSIFLITPFERLHECVNPPLLGLNLGSGLLKEAETSSYCGEVQSALLLNDTDLNR
jgi:hypothetical protein